jgi:hypothetical protein
LNAFTMLAYPCRFGIGSHVSPDCENPHQFHNLFENPLYWTIFLMHKCIPALIKVGRRGSQIIHFCPLSQIKVGSFCFSVPVYEFPTWFHVCVCV